MSKTLSYSQRLEASRAKYASLKPAPLPPPPPIEHPIYHMLTLVLSKGRTTYFAAFRATTEDNRHSPQANPTHLAILRECGEPMQHCPHQLDFYIIPPNAKVLDDVQTTPPVFSMFTRPFVFHMKQSAIDETNRIIAIQTKPE